MKRCQVDQQQVKFDAAAFSTRGGQEVERAAQRGAGGPTGQRLVAMDPFAASIKQRLEQRVERALLDDPCEFASLRNSHCIHGPAS
jgi:hypothetical protein